MKKIRHFIGDCIRLLRRTKDVLNYYYYRNIFLPSQLFLKKYFPNIIRVRTSGSDVKSYRKVCLLAATDDSVFKTFRVHKDYGYNLGQYQNDTRQIALDIIQKEYSDLLKYSKKFEESEKYGGPVIHKCNFGNFSDPTIRYIKTFGDIRKVFGSLDNFKIIEIGAGYGGQCKIISDIFYFSSYNLVDLPEVLALDKKFLTKLNVKNVNYIPPDNVSGNDSYDLIISNFAFAECERSVQQIYIDKILNKAKRGYIIYNFDGHPSQKYDPVRPYYKEEILSILSKYHKLEILKEYPHEKWNNPFIIIWNDTL